MAGETDYEFTNRWFEAARPLWSKLMLNFTPAKILEVGSYEGASTCFLIDHLAPRRPIELQCIDSWAGGVEHQLRKVDMSAVESRFHRNVQKAIAKSNGRAALRVHKGLSHIELSRLLADGEEGQFDFVYIDGSHQAPDVLVDAVLGFKLLKTGGMIVFDDYLWSENAAGGPDPLRCPKIAIDAFTNIYCRKIKIIRAPLSQLYVRKVAD